MPTFTAPNSFHNRTILVTGGAGTLGRPLCIALASAGENVIVNDLGNSPHHQTAASSTQHNPAEELAAEIKSSGFSAIASNHDVVDSAAEIVRLALTAFGKIDAIINCVGIHPYSPFEDQGEEICRKVFDTNVLGPMQIVQAAWPHFKAQIYGRVVFCTSASIFGMENSAAYIASKGALLGLTKSLAFEGTEHGILANAIAPAASPPMVMSAFDILPAEQKEWFEITFKPESNTPAIMALLSEDCKVTGEIFETGAWGVGRIVVGAAKGVGNLRTMEGCITEMGGFVQKDAKIDLYVPTSTPDFVDYKASYI